MKQRTHPDYYGQAFFLLCILLFFICFSPGYAQTVKVPVITTIAGNGDTGYVGNNGPAILAKLDSPTAITIDATGNLYISDQKNNCIRELIPGATPVITTIAGSRAQGYGGDNSPATLAKLNLNWGVAVDGAGNIYISDEQNQRIRRVDAGGIITTIAGDGTPGYYGDGGPATLAKLQFPLGIAADSHGNVYFGDSYNFCIRKIDPGGIITTVAGNGVNGYSGDGVPATVAEIGLTWGMAVDAPGNIYFCDGNNEVREINTSGIISTVAGTGIPGYLGDAGPALSAELYQPLGVYVSKAGEIFISDYGNNRVRRINSSGIISTVAGNGIQGYNGDGKVATAAELSHPISVTMDDTGNIYITDLDNVRIRKVSNVNILSFTGGEVQRITVCENSVASSINTPMTVIDYGAGTTDTWRLVTGPFHGSATVAWSAVATGGTLIPSGLSYTPNTAYVGNDTFKVSVTNGLSSDTTTIYVSVNTMFPSAGIITGPAQVCEKSNVALSDPVLGGMWSTGNSKANVSPSGVVTGIAAGIDTILFIYNNSCATAVAMKTITVNPLPDAGSIIGASAVCSGSTITITDTSPGGSWSTTNTSASIDYGVVTGVFSGFDTIIYTVTNTFCSASTRATLIIDTFTNIGSVTGPEGVCVGSKITLADGTVNGGQWISSNDGATISGGVTKGISPGTDTISYSYTNSCGTATAIKIIAIHPLPDTPAIIQNEYLLTLPPAYTSYQWMQNNTIIPGAVIDSYLVANAGTYSILVTNSYGCVVSSLPVIMPGCSVDDINIYPNPLQSIVYINWCKKLTIKLITIDGRILKTIYHTNEADLSDLPNGDYVISLFDKNGNKIGTKRISKISK